MALSDSELVARHACRTLALLGSADAATVKKLLHSDILQVRRRGLPSWLAGRGRRACG